MLTLPLMTAGFDRASHVKGTPDYCLQMLARVETRLLPMVRGKVAVLRQSDDALAPALLAKQQISGDIAADGMIWIGERDGTPIFALMMEDAAHLPEAVELVDPRTALLGLGQIDGQIVATAITLSAFHRNHQFCGRCGAPMHIADAGLRRDCASETCRNEAFPRSDPAIIVLLHDGADRCLLGRSHRFPPGRLSTLAGFVEPGETLEQAVRREMLEESGLKVKSCRYIASQPWPFPHSLMLAFTAEVDFAEPDAQDEEIEELRWCTRADILGGHEQRGFHIPPPQTIARFLIDGWAEGRL